MCAQSTTTGSNRSQIQGVVPIHDIEYWIQSDASNQMQIINPYIVALQQQHIFCSMTDMVKFHKSIMNIIRDFDRARQSHQ